MIMFAKVSVVYLIKADDIPIIGSISDDIYSSYFFLSNNLLSGQYCARFIGLTPLNAADK